MVHGSKKLRTTALTRCLHNIKASRWQSLKTATKTDWNGRCLHHF